ncbi:hypothetical protein CRI94_08600 [Longibacter salinarum]|uniref:Uncharacterized protein n=1 Tax=Longibacter salinarum TaxID=1850348 RepID=A0A2A8CXS7_9BACT|nr:hypothetical protein CRI94_08600 [Longibacter salinarum]
MKRCEVIMLKWPSDPATIASMGTVLFPDDLQKSDYRLMLAKEYISLNHDFKLTITIGADSGLMLSAGL